MKYQIGENEFITRAEQIAGVMAGNGVAEYWGQTKNIAYRCPWHLMPVLDSMAEVAGKTRTAMLTILLQVGIDEVRSKLDMKTAERLTIAEAKAWELYQPDQYESTKE